MQHGSVTFVCLPRPPAVSGAGAAWLIMASVLLAGHAAGQDTPSVEVENRRCLSCHGRAHLAELSPRERLDMVARLPDDPPLEETDWDAFPETRPGMYVRVENGVGGVHRDLRCIDCHTDAEELPHLRRLEPAACMTCHQQERIDFDRSVHADFLARADADAPTCSSCHGTHQILPPDDRRSLTFPLNVIEVCGSCHERHTAVTARGNHSRQKVLSYLDSVHGEALSEGGLVAAATCADCHGHHDIRPPDDAEALTNRAQIPATCGRCHIGVAETYQKSIHGQLLAAGDPRGPVCTDCHTGHEITHAVTPAFRLDIVGECGECHDRPEMSRGRRASFYDTYRASYHGQITALGWTRAARCSDCHGAHDIKPISDAASRVHPDNLVETCGSCHAGITAKFVAFDPHADYRDARHYPLLHGVWLYFIVLMSSAFGFFGLHSLLWLMRSTIERSRGEHHPRVAGNPHSIRRFTRINRINHGLLIISFFGLTITGIPLLFSDHDWALPLVWAVGGPYAAGLWHRAFAILLICNFVIHVQSLVRAALRYPGTLRSWLFGPTTMLPRLKDVKDCAGMLRWFFRGGRKPPFDRWTYWEKFDYWAEIVGTFIIGGSGLLLWFPVFFAKLLPGWMFNVAMIVHGYEALLAVGFIFTIHFFNTHLRLEKFPVDDVIFTGRIPEAELRLERPEEYDRLVKTGRLDALKVPVAPAWQRRMAILVAFAAVTIGISLLVLIVLAGLQAL